MCRRHRESREAPGLEHLGGRLPRLDVEDRPALALRHEDSGLECQDLHDANGGRERRHFLWLWARGAARRGDRYAEHPRGRTAPLPRRPVGEAAIDLNRRRTGLIARELDGWRGGIGILRDAENAGRAVTERGLEGRIRRRLLEPRDMRGVGRQPIRESLAGGEVQGTHRERVGGLRRSLHARERRRGRPVAFARRIGTAVGSARLDE